VLRKILAKDPFQEVKESKKYRCGLSNRLMTSAVMAPDNNFYKQSCLDPSIQSYRVLLEEIDVPAEVVEEPRSMCQLSALSVWQ
jgi:hypothetical protein